MVELASLPDPVRRRQAVVHGPADERAGGEATAVRILVVEDDYLVALELEHRLMDAGYDVVGIAASAEEAIALARAHAPDLAIMDVRLAGRRDGVDTAIELSATLGIPSIFATAHEDSETRRRAEQARPLGWLRKPYSSEALISLVHGVLEKRR
jgi:two-component system, response regulator PdtaR